MKREAAQLEGLLLRACLCDAHLACSIYGKSLTPQDEGSRDFSTTPMKTRISVSQAQAQLPRLLRSRETIALQRREETVAFIVPKERMEALLETMEILSNPEAMRAIRRDRSGKTKYLPLSVLD